MLASFERRREGRCSLCEQPASETRELAVSTCGRICPECLDVSQDIIAEEMRGRLEPRAPIDPRAELFDPEAHLAELAALGLDERTLASVRESLELAKAVERGDPDAIARVRSAKDYHCSFCGAPRRQVAKLISSPSGFRICDRCVAAAAGALR